MSLQREGAFARLVVEDNGQGIASDFLPLLFSPFSKSPAKCSSGAGLGIGLSIVRALSELQRGRAWAESEGIGRGSRFIIEFPLRDALPTANRDEAVIRGHGELVVVEDNEDARDLVAMSFADMGFAVQAFGSAEAALDALPRLEPDAMVVDIGLPGMDGCELLLRARRMPGLRAIPAIAATAYGQPEDVRRVRQAGFDGHFVKPYDVRELADRIGELLAQRQPA